VGGTGITAPGSHTTLWLVDAMCVAHGSGHYSTITYTTRGTRTTPSLGFPFQSNSGSLQKC
jgi:hypothetical protein